MNGVQINMLKQSLLEKLKEQHVFWSYQAQNIQDISDDVLIEKVLIHLDIFEILELKKVYSKNKIRKVWQENLVTQEPYYHNLNSYFAWFLFGIKNYNLFLKRHNSNRLA